MNKKPTLLAALTIIGLNTATYAMPPRPANCPSASIIKAFGLSYSVKDSDGYTVAQINNYTRGCRQSFI